MIDNKDKMIAADPTDQSAIRYSVIIPIYNEASMIGKVVMNLKNCLDDQLRDHYEIILVDDGSTDNTREILLQIPGQQIRVLNNPYNKGYGSALKLGASKAKGEFLLFYDADGQHNPGDLLALINEGDEYDMIIGWRRGYKGPAWRQPGKRLLAAVASYLVNSRIYDLNSGMRRVRKACFDQYIHLYPDGFSLTTTITLAFIKHGYSIKYSPITINPRVGRSTVRLSDGFKTINFILHTIMLFSPLRVFIPFSLLFFLFGSIFLCLDIWLHNNIGDSTLLLLSVSMVSFFFGLIADQLAAIRRELRLNIWKK